MLDMAPNDDSRPFAVLKENSREFRTLFDKDIQTCLSLLDAKLSSLLRDPESMESPTKEAKRLGAHVEFSKAKLALFLNIKSTIEAMESTWKEQLTNLVGHFLENVEILLAQTNLDLNSSSQTNKVSTVKKTKNSANVISSPMSAYSLINTAKKIPVLNSFLSKHESITEDSEEEDVDIEEDIDIDEDPNIKYQINPKFVVNNSSSKMNEMPKSASRKNVIEVIAEEESSDEDNEVPKMLMPNKINFSPGRLSRAQTAAKQSPEMMTPIKINTGPGRLPKALTAAKQNPVKLTPQKKTTTKGRKSILKVDPTNDIDSFHENDTANLEENGISAAPKTPKNVHFSVGLDISEDLDIYSPVAKITRSAPRRKTVRLSNLPEISSDLNLTPSVIRSKRKTIGGSGMDVSAPSPKRLKRVGRASVGPSISEEPDEDLSEKSDSAAAEHYTSWFPLDAVDTKVPAHPGVFELKVYKAKKSAYIGGCDNLRQKLTLYKIGQNSGHKHLDKFLERNKKDVQVRYEKVSSPTKASHEGQKRIQAFVAQYKTTPAYN